MIYLIGIGLIIAVIYINTRPTGNPYKRAIDQCDGLTLRELEYQLMKNYHNKLYSISALELSKGGPFEVSEGDVKIKLRDYKSLRHLRIVK